MRQVCLSLSFGEGKATCRHPSPTANKAVNPLSLPCCPPPRLNCRHAAADQLHGTAFGPRPCPEELRTAWQALTTAVAFCHRYSRLAKQQQALHGKVRGAVRQGRVCCGVGCGPGCAALRCCAAWLQCPGWAPTLSLLAPAALSPGCLVVAAGAHSLTLRFARCAT